MRLIDANEIENLFNAQVERGARRHYETSYIVTACPQYEVG